MDSRVIDIRPNVNETIEKRKLVTYNNPTRAVMSELSIPERTSVSNNEENCEANANVDSKRSARVMHPPLSFQKKEAGFNS